RARAIRPASSRPRRLRALAALVAVAEHAHALLAAAEVEQSRIVGPVRVMAARAGELAFLPLRIGAPRHLVRRRGYVGSCRLLLAARDAEGVALLGAGPGQVRAVRVVAARAAVAGQRRVRPAHLVRRLVALVAEVLALAVGQVESVVGAVRVVAGRAAL